MNEAADVAGWVPAPKASYIGHVDGMPRRSVNGWIANASNFEERLSIDILVDGVFVTSYVADIYRSDLLKAGIGDGYHSFSVELPRTLFDGQRHDVVVRESMSGWALPELSRILFDSAHRLDLTSHLVPKLRGHELVGFVYDRRDPGMPVAVALRVDGVTIAQTLADRPVIDMPGDPQRPRACAFSFDLAGLDIGRLVKARMEVVTLPDQFVLGQLSDLGKQVASVKSMMSDEALYLTLDLAFALRKNVSFDVYVDQTQYTHATMGLLAELRSVLIQIPLQQYAGAEHTISVCYAQTNVHVGNSPQAFSHSSRRNLARNSRFEAWSGRELEAWSVSVPAGVSFSPSYRNKSEEAVASLGPYAIAFSQDENEASLGGASLEQTLQISPKGIEGIDAIIGGRADTRTEIVVSLRLKPGDGDPTELRETLVFWPHWSVRTARFPLAAGKVGASARLAAEICAGDAKLVQFSLFAAGARGFSPEGEARTLPAAGGPYSNAVVNGSFTHWSGPLRRSAQEHRVAVADGWSLVCKQSSIGIEARLTELLTRDPKNGRAGSLAYGIAVEGPIVGIFLWLEGELDKLQLAICEPAQLSFYARRGAVDVLAGEAGPLAIGEIFIACRTILPDGTTDRDFKDHKLLTLSSRIDLSSVGELHEISLTKHDAKLLRETAIRDLYNSSSKMLLVFEFRHSVNCALADICLGHNRDGAQLKDARLRTDGYVAIEDANIAAQLPLLNGLAHWSQSQRLQAPPRSAKARRGRSRDRSWRWPEGATRSVDIVICVHDALQETLDCLESVQACTDIPHTVTIVDDGSTSLNRERLRHRISADPWIHLIELKGNHGYTKAANIGISRSTAEWIVLLNSDTVVTPGWLDGLFDVVNAKPNVAMVGPLSNAASWQSVPDLHDAKGGWKINSIPPGTTIDEVAGLVASLSRREFPEVPLLNGFCTLMLRSVLEEVGFLDEVAFPIGYGEENDLCVRVGKAGYGLAIADHVYVYHVKSASFGSRKRDELSKRGTTNFIAKHPDVDLRAAQRVLAEATPLIELRKALRAHLEPGVLNQQKASM